MNFTEVLTRNTKQKPESDHSPHKAEIKHLKKRKKSGNPFTKAD